MELSVEQRGFVIETFLKNGDSVIATQRAFCIHFQLGLRARAPSRNTVLTWVDSVCATGSTLKEKPPGRPMTVRTPGNVESVGSPVASTISSQTCRCSEIVLHYGKTHFAFRSCVPSLQDGNCAKTSCTGLGESCELLSQTSDEAHFHLTGCVNKLNFRYWLELIHRDINERPLHCERVTI